MKKEFILFFFLFLLLPPVLAQQAEATFEPSLKYGKPSDEELSMTTYAPDTAATALVLYSKCNARYDLIANEFRLIYSYEVKIKVLKTDGTSSANINTPYYSNVTAQIRPDGVVIGQRQTGYSGQCAAEFRKRYQSAKKTATVYLSLPMFSGKDSARHLSLNVPIRSISILDMLIPTAFVSVCPKDIRLKGFPRRPI